MSQSSGEMTQTSESALFRIQDAPQQSSSKLYSVFGFHCISLNRYLQNSSYHSNLCKSLTDKKKRPDFSDRLFLSGKQKYKSVQIYHYMFQGTRSRQYFVYKYPCGKYNLLYLHQSSSDKKNKATALKKNRCQIITS